jgi:hypothetical protein
VKNQQPSLDIFSGDKRKERERLIEQYVNTRCYVFVSDCTSKREKLEKEEQN